MIKHNLNNINGFSLKCGITSDISIDSNGNFDSFLNLLADDSILARINMDIVEDAGHYKIKIIDLLNGKGGSPLCKIKINLPTSEIDLDMDVVKSDIKLNGLNINSLKLKNVKGILNINDSTNIKKMFLKLVSIKSDIAISNNLTTAKIDITNGVTNINAADFKGELECKSVGAKVMINDMILSGKCNFKKSLLKNNNQISCKVVSGSLLITNYNDTTT